MRVGLYVDAAFRSEEAPDGERVYAGAELLGFGRFAATVGARWERFFLIARGGASSDRAPYELPPGVELWPLPGYPSLRSLGAFLAALPRTLAELWRAAGRLDLLWVSASHPVGLAAAAIARLRGAKVAILVRQDSMDYFRARLPGRLWRPLLAPLWLVDRAFRLLARRLPTTAVGAATAAKYGGGRPNVLRFAVNLVEREAIPPRPPQRDWAPGARIVLLAVGRAEPEKDPLAFVEMLGLLERRRPGRFAAVWAGAGRLRPAMAERSAALGLERSLVLPGFVPFGPELAALYEEAHLFVHVSLTEGEPAALNEAMAAGLPVVATDVGGVAEAVGGGAAGILVPPRSPGALADAVLALEADAQRREAIARAALERARSTCLDSQSEAVAAFLEAA